MSLGDSRDPPRVPHLAYPTPPTKGPLQPKKKF